MKKYYLYILSFIMLISACKEMDSEYKDFIVPNGLTYPQKADSLKIYPGFNRLKLQWLKPKFPGVKYSMMYWNNFADSIKVDFPANSDTVSIIVSDLSEDSYSFYIKNYDEQGISSIPVEATGTPYGENFLIGASDRTYLSAIRDNEGNGTIVWGNKTPNLVYTEVIYMNSLGVEKTVRVSPEEMESVLPAIDTEKHFQYRSVFLPPNGIDLMEREWQTSEKPFLFQLARENWTIEARNGNHDWGDGGGGQPTLLLDGDIKTGWHSKVGAELPQVVVADMKQSFLVDQVVVVPSSNVSWRYMNEVDIYVSDQPIPADQPNESWGEPAASVLYAGEDTFTIEIPETTRGRYVAVVFKDSKSQTYISFMELEVYGR